MAAPIITIGTPSATKISAISGHDQATVTFQSDVNLHNWEARATYQGQTVGHGSGLLVESGGSLAANTNATVYVENEELTEGDREYTITVFGHGSDGYWSDGTYEAVNVIDYSDCSIGEGTTVSNDGTVIYNTTLNTDISSSQIVVERWYDSACTEGLAWIRTTGNKSIQIEMSQSDTDIIRIAFFGNNDYTSVYFYVSGFEYGLYSLSFNVFEVGLNHADIRNVILVKTDNVLDYDKYSAGSGTTFDYGTIVHDTGSSNQDHSKIHVETSKNWSYVDELANFDSTGNKTVQITIDSSIDMFRIGLFGDTDYTSIYFRTYYIEDGNYILSFNIEELTLNHAVITDVKVTKAVI